MRAIACGRTDIGLQREHNEDSFLVLPEHGLFVVADGMGGHRAGDVASQLATEIIGEIFRSIGSDEATWPFHIDKALSDAENHLLSSIRFANRQIFERGLKSRALRGMGTTIVSALFSPREGRVYIAHVGDSRCYRVRQGQISLLTRDHSLLNDYLLAIPELSEQQQAELPRNVITRALGMQGEVTVDLRAEEADIGDIYLLCSDGLSGMVSDDELLDIVTSTDDLDEASSLLIQQANSQGGEDNITAIVMRIEEG